MKPNIQLQKVLDSAYLDFHSKKERALDPVCFPHQYTSPKDQETVAFLSALLAYGNVRTIMNSVSTVLKPLGASPKQALLTNDTETIWKGFRHRFTTADDIVVLSHWLTSAFRSHETLECFFADSAFYPKGTMKELLSDFVKRFTQQPLPKRVSELKVKRERNLKYLISDPERGSACKRLNLFLRWVVRPSDGIDLGIWKKIKPHQLMLPIDTHLLKTLRQLRWTRSNTASWNVVEETTLKLRDYCPEDPIRYDFSLCHLSMRGFAIGDYRKTSL